MCLESPFKNVTSRTDRIRWKVLKVDGRKGLVSPIYQVKWTVGAEKRAHDHTKKSKYTDYHNVGIHCYLSKQDAVRYGLSQAQRDGSKYCIVKLKVSNLNQAGNYSFWVYKYYSPKMRLPVDKTLYNIPCETWKRATILEVYSLNGRKNVTHLYAKFKYRARKGDIARLKGKQQTAIIMSTQITVGNDIIQGACRLNKPLGGLKYWNQDDLELVNRPELVH